MRVRLAAICAALSACGTPMAVAAPDGCWSIRDAIERLACFDMALGPPEHRQGEPPAMMHVPAAGPAENARPKPRRDPDRD